MSREAGYALGRFHSLISDLDVERLRDTLPGFHITPSYLAHYDEVLEKRLEVMDAADKLLGLYLPYGSLRTKAVFLADLDGDGNLDALIARVWGAEIWWNDGWGEFLRSEVRFKYREDTGVATGDFDGDGDQDIFLGRNEQDYQVWWNDGKGIFSDGRQQAGNISIDNGS